MGNLVLLQELVAHDNLLGTIPNEVCSLEQLQRLDLSFNRIRELPPHLKQLGELRELKLGHNMLEQLPGRCSPPVGVISKAWRKRFVGWARCDVGLSAGRLGCGCVAGNLTESMKHLVGPASCMHMRSANLHPCTCAVRCAGLTLRVALAAGDRSQLQPPPLAAQEAAPPVQAQDLAGASASARHAMCDVRCAVCGVRCAVCGVRCA
eukprot:394019-Rhodomonas_salina.1